MHLGGVRILPLPPDNMQIVLFITVATGLVEGVIEAITPKEPALPV